MTFRMVSKIQTVKVMTVAHCSTKWTQEHGRQAVRLSVRIQRHNNALLLNNETVGTKEVF
jgi:hypothetical protein